MNRTKYCGLSQNVRNLKSLSNEIPFCPCTLSKSNSQITFATNSLITATAIAPPEHPLRPWLKDEIWEQLSIANEEVKRGYTITTPLEPVCKQILQLLVMFLTEIGSTKLLRAANKAL
jgi:hypothetical protein